MPLPGRGSISPEMQERIDALAARVGPKSAMARTELGDVFAIPASVEKMDFRQRVDELQAELAAKSAEATKELRVGGAVRPIIAIDREEDLEHIAKQVVLQAGQVIGIKHKPALSLVCCHEMVEVYDSWVHVHNGNAARGSGADRRKWLRVRVCYHCGEVDSGLGEEETG